jgi:hypothetical protein
LARATSSRFFWPRIHMDLCQPPHETELMSILPPEGENFNKGRSVIWRLAFTEEEQVSLE